MADGTDGNSGSGGQRALALEMGDHRWTLAGGWTEPGALCLKVAVIDGCDVRRVSIRLPIDTSEDGSLHIGKPAQWDGWPE